MIRTRLAGHDATDVNPAWHLETLTGTHGVDEVDLTCGDGWLTFNPHDAADRIQMWRLANGLADAASRRTYSGASHTDLCELLGEWADAHGHPEVAALAEVLGNLHSEPGVDRDSVSVEQHRAQLGLDGRAAA